MPFISVPPLAIRKLYNFFQYNGERCPDIFTGIPYQLHFTAKQVLLMFLEQWLIAQLPLSLVSAVKRHFKTSKP
ncbi:unnamed protein product [Angiostrongylus costaricensis]|uniref:Uncharacterized protein n=1 Tax=Angiostrongylus costaricensis TaxID=334426 RepID=A0A0R3PSX9_ANGCS|nr:unnamed protein product [Angiostrongylus costaricensis]